MPKILILSLILYNTLAFADNCGPLDRLFARYIDFKRLHFSNIQTRPVGEVASAIFRDSQAMSVMDENGEFTTQMMKRSSNPSGRGLTPLVFDMQDIQYARAHGRIFDDISPARLPAGSYTFVILENGGVSFARVEDGWEIGGKHFILARGRRAVSAGELRIRPDGTYDWNILSGSVTQRMIRRGHANPIDMMLRTSDFFTDQMGRAGNYIESTILPTQPPSRAEIRRLCANAIFVENNPSMVDVIVDMGIRCP